ncbi:MAG: type II secretion system major pseudopilin GspG [Planctomycetes bacterium]|nr:type II secretion system major pseudopilin GspG [Planctomycetota bacterium]
MGRQLGIEASRHRGKKRWSDEAQKRQSGMTLVEILAVVVILGLIAGTLLVGFSGSFAKAKHELAKSGIGIIVSQLETYRLEHSAWPSNDQGLAVLTDGLATPSASYYLNPGQLLDPWMRTYLYVTPGPSGHPYEVLCYGADGQPGGEGESADISSTNLRGID